jgi:AraC-like DNA-binding protein
MKLYIKNMVCTRCKTTVKTDLDKLGILYSSVELGEVTITEKLSEIQSKLLCKALKQSGFELINIKNYDLIENLKRTISELETNSNENLDTSYSDLISMRTHDSYISLNALFSEIKGITIEKYIIRQKVERVKELLGHENLDISEIAVKMHYTSVAKLSSQFKSLTGLTPLHFKQLRHISLKNQAIN